MNRQRWLMLAAVLVLIGASAGYLFKMQNGQTLGTPGLKVVDIPIYDPEGNVAGTHSVYLPEELSGYTSEALPVTRLELDWLPKDTVYGRRAYQAGDGFRSMASVVLMGADRTSIHQPQYCLTGQGWKIDDSEIVTIPINHPHRYDLPVMKMTVTRQQKMADGQTATFRGIYVYWFVSQNQLTADHLQRMWWMARDLVLTGVLQRWAYVTYFSVCLPGQEEMTFARLQELIAASVPEFQLPAGKPLDSTVSALH